MLAISLGATRAQHQQEVNELVENVKMSIKRHMLMVMCMLRIKIFFMTIPELKAKLKLVEKEKNVNTKFDKSVTLEKLICVTPLNKNKDLKAKIVSKVEVKTDKSKPVTSCSTPKNEQGQKKNANQVLIVLARSESKDTKSKKRVLLNTKSKSTSKDVKKSQSSFTSVVNKKDTMNSNVSESKANVLKAKTINVVHDGQILVKRALFTSPVAAKSSKLGATPVVAKSRQSKTLSTGLEKKDLKQ
ncbi:hypothetical protein Tco_0909625 [Tanacetum coccineum]|uniref:Uncharacterized protein n=1 Tax=Tanacetum coccineum TaxID=301880 RepID=A0ABQ5CRR9_9ASTR